MKNNLSVLKAFNLEVNEENIHILTKNHDYISDKLILDALNGVNVVAKDHHEVLKLRQSTGSRLLGGITGSSKKHQDMINENVIEGINACTTWLQDHDRHLTRVDQRIVDIANELDKTQEEILKFYSQHVNLRNRVGELEDSFFYFVNISKERFCNIEERIKNLEIKSRIEKEISLLKSGKKYENYELPIKIYSLLDNLFTGEMGIYYSNNPKKQHENILYLESELINIIKNEVGSNYKKELLDFDTVCQNLNNIDILEKNALSFISTQQYNQLVNQKNHPEICDFVSIVSSYDLLEAKNEISKQSNISNFLTYDDFLNIALKEYKAG